MANPPDFDERTEEERDADLAPDSTSNPVAVTRKKKDDKRRAAAIEETLSNLLKDGKGRIFLQHILFDLCGLMGGTENAAYDSNAMHFREGMRAPGLVLHGECTKSDRDAYAMLWTEYIRDLK